MAVLLCKAGLAPARRMMFKEIKGQRDKIHFLKHAKTTGRLNRSSDAFRLPLVTEDDVAEAAYTEDYEEDAGSRGELVDEEDDEGGAAAAREEEFAAPPLNAVNLDVNQSVSYLDDDALDVEFDDAQEQFLDEVEEADYTIVSS